MPVNQKKRLEEVPHAAEEVVALRKVLFYIHPCEGKYGDDGEMQCAACGIDFKRSPIHVLEYRLGVLYREQLVGLYHSADELTEAGG